jgi:hypothetical protein
VTTELHDESHKELGIFHAARNLHDRGSLSRAEELLLVEIRDWFNDNLEKPKRFSSAKPPYCGKRQNGIARFKDSVHQHIAKMREMAFLLEHHDVPVRMMKTARPGYVVYEDGFQIVAVPFADSDL